MIHTHICSIYFPYMFHILSIDFPIWNRKTFQGNPIEAMCFIQKGVPVVLKAARRGDWGDGYKPFSLWFWMVSWWFNGDFMGFQMVIWWDLKGFDGDLMGFHWIWWDFWWNVMVIHRHYPMAIEHSELVNHTCFIYKCAIFYFSIAMLNNHVVLPRIPSTPMLGIGAIFLLTPPWWRLGIHDSRTPPDTCSTYPLVICYIAIEHGHRNSWFTLW